MYRALRKVNRPSPSVERNAADASSRTVSTQQQTAAHHCNIQNDFEFERILAELEADLLNSGTTMEDRLDGVVSGSCRRGVVTPDVSRVFPSDDEDEEDIASDNRSPQQILTVWERIILNAPTRSPSSPRPADRGRSRSSQGCDPQHKYCDGSLAQLWWGSGVDSIM